LRILFITWDGPQVSYLQSLFLPIFSGLKDRGFEFDILQFRWGTRDQEEAAAEACRRAGLGYHAINIWRRGGAAGPLLSALIGGRHVRNAVRKFGSDVIMPRSVMPGIAVLAAGGAKSRPILFDADGLEVDERVDVAGLSPTSMTYRILRDVEAQVVRLSTSIVTRTTRAAEILCHRAGPPTALRSFHVVSNGRDESLFHPFDPEARAATRRRLGIAEGAPLLVYAGSIGPQYGVVEMKALFREVLRLRPDSRLLVLTGNIDRASEAFGEEGEVATIMRVAPDEVSQFLAAGDVGMAYRSTHFSMQGVAPIKLSEYLLCGLPVIGTAAIGDTEAAVDEGLFLDEESGAQEAARWFVNDVMPRREDFRRKARAVGQHRFSLARSVEDYAKALEPFNAFERADGSGSRK
jgi:glycosyltransferase involved in cell wall biosynthesis